MVTLATTACQPASDLQISIAGAQRIDYASIRDASGVLGYAEPLLGPALATRYSVPVDRGAAAVEPDKVVGAWTLPAGTEVTALREALSQTGSLDRVRDQSAGQLWIADYRPRGQNPVRLLYINGAHPAFERNAVAEVRPGNHVYLIAYRLQ